MKLFLKLFGGVVLHAATFFLFLMWDTNLGVRDSVFIPFFASVILVIFYWLSFIPQKAPEVTPEQELADAVAKIVEKNFKVRR